MDEKIRVVGIITPQGSLHRNLATDRILNVGLADTDLIVPLLDVVEWNRKRIAELFAAHILFGIQEDRIILIVIVVPPLVFDNAIKQINRVPFLE